MRINLFRSSDFLKNSAKLVAGTAMAQAISFLVTPLITRLYTPADVGVFTFFISIAGGIGLIATLRYEMAVVPQKEEKDSVNVAFIALGIAFFLCLALTAIILLVNFLFLPGLLTNPVYRQWIYLLPVMAFMVASGNVFQQWYNRKKEYRTLATAKVVNAAGNNFLTLLLGFLGIGVWGLLAGNFFGLLVFNLFFVIGILMRHRENLRHFDISSQKSLARKYKDLPLANTPQILVELVQVYGIIFLLQAFFSAEIVGWYSLSQRLLQAPLTLIGTSFAQVFYKEASERHVNQGNLTDLTKKTIKMAAIVAFLPLITMLTMGPWLIGFIFGPAWHEAGVYARILAPWLFFDFIRASISYTPIIIGKTRTMFYITVIGALLMIAQISLGGLFFKNEILSLILLSGTLSLYSIGVILWIVHSVKTETTFSRA
ncbi:MAG: oligosaccharide flippase family protein [Bacteroidetes bacterium]|nr:oligosaccharide flippase family protein [Bacteroidota bacterium]